VPTLPDKNNTVIQEEDSEMASQMRAMAFNMSRYNNITLPICTAPFAECDTCSRALDCHQ